MLNSAWKRVIMYWASTTCLLCPDTFLQAVYRSSHAHRCDTLAWSKNNFQESSSNSQEFDLGLSISDSYSLTSNWLDIARVVKVGANLWQDWINLQRHGKKCTDRKSKPEDNKPRSCKAARESTRSPTLYWFTIQELFWMIYWDAKEIYSRSYQEGETSNPSQTTVLRMALSPREH